MRLSFHGNIEIEPGTSTEEDIAKMERVEQAIRDVLDAMDDVDVEYVEVEA